MSAPVRFDGRRVVDHDINGVPILEGRALPLPRYDIKSIESAREKVRLAGGMQLAKMIEDFGNWPVPEVSGNQPSPIKKPPRSTSER